MRTVVKVTDADFDAKVVRAAGPVLAVFRAEWSDVCRVTSMLAASIRARSCGGGSEEGWGELGLGDEAAGFPPDRPSRADRLSRSRGQVETGMARLSRGYRPVWIGSQSVSWGGNE
ncbi:hypothetical protein [Streptomyces clavuligerus]|uniref:hypothetical protein n=1 Tax=Streptomyces clavuligerus TaxID=1901 RepID=UPI000185193E|nr:hypothetical protein [Streptomyces clavuligerus]QPJ98056.1 hypothetical protein GE265_34085 [Streptomyces clavuligerus]